MNIVLQSLTHLIFSIRCILLVFSFSGPSSCIIGWNLNRFIQVHNVVLGSNRINTMLIKSLLHVSFILLDLVQHVVKCARSGVLLFSLCPHILNQFIHTWFLLVFFPKFKDSIVSDFISFFSQILCSLMSIVTRQTIPQKVKSL